MLPSALYSLLFPPNVLILLLVVGLLAGWLHKLKLAVTLVCLGLFWVMIWSLPATSLWLGGHLEQRYERLAPHEYPHADAIVVLGGHIQGNRHNWFEPYDRDRVISRESVAAQLYHADRAELILLSSGALHGKVSDTVTMAKSLHQMGIAPDAIIQETKSQNTLENARLTDQTLRELEHQHILLVTSALHMPRAMTAFENQPMAVTPAPLPVQIQWPHGTKVSRWLPNLHTLLASQAIIKEYLGLFLYWLHGKLLS